MSRTDATLAVLAAAVLALSVVGPVAAGGGVTVTVVDGNGTAVSDASVTVSATNNSTYVGNQTTLSGTTGANGTVTFQSPDSNVSVDVSASKNNSTGSTTADLAANGSANLTVTITAPTDGNETDNGSENGTDETDAFGQRVSAFVHELLSNESVEGGIGPLVAEFVVANNPGADHRPDHAGPPAWVFGDDGNETERGPGNAGPPEHAGPPSDDGNETERGGGPPADAGPPADRGGDDGNETERGGGPPDHAGPPGDAGPPDDGDDEDDEEDDS